MADTWTTPSGPSAGNIVLAEMQAQRTDNIDVVSRAVDGDSSASTIKHRHKVGTLASRPTPGEAGRIYYATDLGLWLFDDGTEWAPYQHNPKKCVHFGSEFAGPVPSTTNHSTWDLEVNGTGGVTIPTADDAVWELGTGTDANSWVSVQNRGSGSQQGLLASRVFVYMVRFKHLDPTAGTQIFYAGLYADAVDAPTDAIYLRKVSANVIATVRSSSVDRDTQDLGNDASSFNTYIVEYDGSDVKVYLDTWNAGGLKLTTSTSLPTARMQFGLRHSVTTSPPSSRDTQVSLGHIWIARS